MSASIRYFLTTKTHCQECDGKGYVLRNDGSEVGDPCEQCDGKGFVLGEQEVELASTPNGTGFVMYDRGEDDA